MYGDHLTLVNKTKKKMYGLSKIIKGKHGSKLSHKYLTPHGDINSEAEFFKLLCHIIFLNKDDDIILVEDEEIEEGERYAEFIDYDDSGVDFEQYFSVINKNSNTD